MTITKVRYRSIAIADLSYLFKKNWHTPSLMGLQLGAAKQTLTDLENLRRDVGHLIIARDSKPYFRSQLFPEYKANRPERQPDEIAQLKWLYNEIIRLGYNVAHADGFEADDCIATLAKAYGEWCDDVRIVAADKDAAQCITDHVLQYIPPVGNRDWNVRTVDGVFEKWGVKPDQMAAFQAIAGDKSDGIPGVPLIGEDRAAKLLQEHGSLAGIYAAMTDAAAVGSKLKIVENFISHWDKVRLYLKLTTLVTNVPLDLEGLLIRREPEPEQRAHNDMADVSVDGYVGNETPTPPDAAGDALYQTARKVYEAQFVTANDKVPESAQTQASKREDLLEAEYDNERATQGESDPVKSDPGDKAATPPPVTQAQRAAATMALVRKAVDYGLVDAKLQPVDLRAAYTVSEWIVSSKLYVKKFQTPSQVFVVIARGKELGLGMIISLENTHIIEGKPASSADLIRGLAERDPSFEYLYPTHQSATSCTWAGRRKGMPAGAEVSLTYTLEDAAKAGLVRLGQYGGKGPWYTRPQDMLNKTAASKLARQLWAASTMGLYCPEELGYAEEELDQREAA